MMRNLLVSMSLVALAACGGGGGGASTPASSTSQPASVPPPVVSAPPATANATASADLALASRLYKGDERTPSGFDVETRPANVVGTLSTRHLKNTDFSASNATFEMCTNDMAQAIDWSESQATYLGQYSDLVEIRSDSHMFEVVRVPRADVTAMVRHRVFRCDYVDRSTTNLRVDVGAAGSMNQRPLTADELEKLTEYLWQFTMFNNSDYAVESSTRSTNGNSLVQTIRMGQLVRGAAGSCDTVQISDWTHTMNAADGTLTRALSNVRTFQVRSGASGATSCAG